MPALDSKEHNLTLCLHVEFQLMSGGGALVGLKAIYGSPFGLDDSEIISDKRHCG